MCTEAPCSCTKENKIRGGGTEGEEERERKRETDRERKRKRKREKGKEERRGKRKTTPNRRTRVNECTDQRHTLGDDPTKTEPVDAPHDCDAHGAPPSGGRRRGVEGWQSEDEGREKGGGCIAVPSAASAPRPTTYTPNRRARISNP